MDLATLTLPTVTLAGHAVPLDVVHLDSGEEPESACTQTLIGAHVGTTTYQCLNRPINEALATIVRAIDADLRRHLAPAPALLTVVIARFQQRVVVDWDAAVSPLARATALLQARRTP